MKNKNRSYKDFDARMSKVCMCVCVPKRAMPLVMWIESASYSSLSVVASAFDNALVHSSAFRGTSTFSFRFVLFRGLAIIYYICLLFVSCG